MTKEEFTPHPPNDLKKRLDEQDVLIRELLALTKDLVVHVARMTESQEAQSDVLQRLSSALAAKQPRA